tara:strand:+ start:995 stop:1159 length:165 start_codon:yes stop_codon:yes gene_type:complete
MNNNLRRKTKIGQDSTPRVKPWHSKMFESQAFWIYVFVVVSLMVVTIVDMMNDF